MGPKRQKATTSSGRPRKRAKKGYDDTVGSDHEEAGHSSHRRNQLMIEDEEEDIQGGYVEADGQFLEDIFIPPKYTRVEHAQTGERLVIEKIVCENFKSYGGVKEMGPFHKSFSAIVGPNGNGKSNIIDAMLFVFGYRAAKIRCKKVSVLIHKSELLPSLSGCAVTVHFVKIVDTGQNDDNFDVVPNSKITVTRRANSDNSSAYSLNGKRVIFQDVASFLKTNGIDIVHNRFLILQGEVESIAQMPPKTPNGLETGLLEFLEEVIGTKRYIKCLVALEQRVEQLDYDREEKLHRVDLVEKEKQAMQEPVKKAKDFLRDHNTKAKYQHQICQVKISHASKKCIELSEKIDPLKTKIQAVNTRLEEIKTINESRKAEFDQEEKLYNKKKAEHDKKKKTFEANEAEHVKHYENIKRDNEQRKKLLLEKGKKEKEIEKLDEIPRENESQKEKLAKRKTDLDEDITKEEAVVQREMEKLNVKINALLRKKVDVDKVFNEWLPQRHEKKMTVEQLSRDLETYKATSENESQKLEQYKKELEDLKEDIQKREKQARSSMEGKVGKLQESLEQKEREFPVIVREEQQKRHEMITLSSAVEEAREAVECSGATDNIYKLFFGEKEQGRLEGLYGRLKDLATIDEKYNVAVTVSTGMLEFWVVDNDTTAETCINLLKQKRMPFQNFICLNRLTGPAQDMRHRFDAPDQSHRLFDLLQITKQEVAPAFYKALRNTLVAPNLEIGSKIAYGQRRHRVATLAGELIEATGSMTGGGRAKIVGKMNSGMAARLTSKVSRKDYENLKRQYDDLNGELKALSGRKTQLESEIYHLKSEIKGINDKVKNFQGDLANLKKQLPFKEKRVKDQEVVARKAAVDPKLLKMKEQAMKSAEKELAEIMESSKDAEAAATKLTDELKDLQVTKRNDIRKKLEKFLKQRKLVVEEIDKIVVELKNYQKNRSKASERIKTLDRDIIKLQNNMEKWSQARKAIEASSKVLKAELDTLSTEVEEAKEELTKRKEVLNEFKDEEKELAKTKVEVDAKIEEMSGALKSSQKQIKYHEHIMEGLVLKEIPEEEVPPLATLSEEELEELNLKELEHKLNKYEKKLQGESPNLNILEEYKRKIELFLARVEELDDVTARRDKFRDAYISTTAQRLAEFMEGFAVISSKLKEMFRMISMGGDAELDLVDSTDPFSSGVQFSVRPARKTWKKISNLSGGEKTLSSLALIFALHYFKPSPFYVMDEIDAALDFKNVSIIANYIKDRTKFTQFIIISLRSNMFELADSLLGVYKVDNMSYSIHIGVSKMLSIMKSKFDEAGKPFPLDTQGTEASQSTKPGSSTQQTGAEGTTNGSQPIPNIQETEQIEAGDGIVSSSSNGTEQGPTTSSNSNSSPRRPPSVISAIDHADVAGSGDAVSGSGGDDHESDSDHSTIFDNEDDIGMPLLTSTPRRTFPTSPLVTASGQRVEEEDEDDTMDVADTESEASRIVSGANSDRGSSSDFEFD